MKIVPIVAVRDALQGFRNIAIVPNIAVGQRGFINSCRFLLELHNDDSLSVPDLSLYHVGDFNLETGEVIPMDKEIVATPPTLYVEEETNDDN